MFPVKVGPFRRRGVGCARCLPHHTGQWADGFDLNVYYMCNNIYIYGAIYIYIHDIHVYDMSNNNGYEELSNVAFPVKRGPRFNQ